MYKGIQFDETLKNLVLHFRLNTYACIGNVETQMSLIKLIIAYPYISFFRKFKRIVYKVGKMCIRDRNGIELRKQEVVDLSDG